MNINKTNGECNFNEAEHIYWLGEDESNTCISVTRLLSLYHSAFDADFWSKYKAFEILAGEVVFLEHKEHLLRTRNWSDELLEELDEASRLLFEETSLSIKQGYDQKGREAAEIGTRFHSEREESIKQDDTELRSILGIAEDWSVSTEVLLANTESRIAGLCDGLCVGPDGEIIIFDWKTSKKISLKGFYDRDKRKTEKMFYPISHIEDSNFWHYALQLSFYAYIYKQSNPGTKVGKLVLLHSKGDKIIQYPCPYLEDEIKLVIDDYKTKVLL